jgi:hypothetical protein
MQDIGVIYLYRFTEGEEPALRFLRSYHDHRAGLDHDLNIVFKGFPDAETLARARALFAGTATHSIEVDDSGYDLGSYAKAARAIRNERLVFLNTFSQVLAHNWLAHFNRALQQLGVGLVGATGSWAANTAGYEATFRLIMRRLMRQPARYHQSFDTEPMDAGLPRAAASRKLKLLLLAPFDYVARFIRFGRFPNPHIRTNAFMMTRDRFLALDFPSFGSKLGAYKFESGRRSMTKQILRRDLRAVVVGRDGQVYDASEWQRSSTFRMNDQANLLVADNRTMDYAGAGLDRRKYLQKLTWVHPWDWDSVDTPSGGAN